MRKEYETTLIIDGEIQGASIPRAPRGVFSVSRYGVEPINRNWTFRRSATENHAQALRMAAYARLRGGLPACRELVALAKSYRIHG